MVYLSKKELAKRYLVFIIGLFISGLGVALTKHAELGVSPNSSLANVLSCRFEFLSMGSWLIVTNCMLILAQMLILRKKFQPVQLLQIPVSFLFGYFIDFGLWCCAGIPTELYIVRLICLIAGVAVLGLGVAISVIPNVVMNSAEALVKVISDITNKNFANVKIAFDIFNVVLSVVLSLLFFNFTIVGTREGTLIAAVFTGIFVKIFTRLLKEPINKIFDGNK